VEFIDIMTDKILNLFNINDEDIINRLINKSVLHQNVFYILKFGTLYSAYVSYFANTELESIILPYIYKSLKLISFSIVKNDKSYILYNLNEKLIVRKKNDYFRLCFKDNNFLASYFNLIIKNTADIYSDIVKSLHKKLYTNEMYLKYFKDMEIKKGENDDFYIDLNKTLLC
jgi:hypothetical protein